MTDKKAPLENPVNMDDADDIINKYLKFCYETGVDIPLDIYLGWLTNYKNLVANGSLSKAIDPNGNGLEITETEFLNRKLEKGLNFEKESGEYVSTDPSKIAQQVSAEMDKIDFSSIEIPEEIAAMNHLGKVYHPPFDGNIADNASNYVPLENGEPDDFPRDIVSDESLNAYEKMFGPIKIK